MSRGGACADGGAYQRCCWWWTGGHRIRAPEGLIVGGGTTVKGGGDVLPSRRVISRVSASVTLDVVARLRASGELPEGRVKNEHVGIDRGATSDKQQTQHERKRTRERARTRQRRTWGSVCDAARAPAPTPINITFTLNRGSSRGHPPLASVM